ncbi:MAG TPA: hypothetical protein VHW74_13885 [Mycobacteriales bacterium]|jgi:hypothetical protein|nr:hypothetical protein [Mycobacteriales bacterium]
MSSGDPNQEAVTPGTVKRLFILSMLPFAGFVLVVVGGILWFKAASDNNSLSCNSFGSFGAPSGCTHHSYVAAIVLVVIGVVIAFGGGMYANYYAARQVGLPLLGAFLNRSRAQQMQQTPPPQPPLNPPPGE